MNLGLETDVSNKNFMGAVTNPDDMLSVEFYEHESLDIFASREKNVKTFRPKAVFIRKVKPGDGLSIIERVADDNDKAQFPVQWLRFQMAAGLMEVQGDIPGWKITDWPELNEDQVRFLTFQRFQTVEQIAAASDHQIQGIGMGGVTLREKARAALRSKMDSSFRGEIEARDLKIAALEKNIEFIMNKIGSVAGEDQREAMETEVRPKLGVPKK